VKYAARCSSCMFYVPEHVNQGTCHIKGALGSCSLPAKWVARRWLVSPFLTNDTNPSSFQGVQIVPEERTGNKGSSDHASGWRISNGNERRGRQWT
jgi:hypothetical protein